MANELSQNPCQVRHRRCACLGIRRLARKCKGLILRLPIGDSSDGLVEVLIVGFHLRSQQFLVALHLLLNQRQLGIAAEKIQIIYQSNARILKTKVLDLRDYLIRTTQQRIVNCKISQDHLPAGTNLTARRFDHLSLRTFIHKTVI